MDEQSQQTALLSALTTEHFVLRTAQAIWRRPPGAVAMGFLSGSADVLIPFAATVLPTVFLIGIFTVVRLVETALESMHYLDGIASIRGYYRTLGSYAARHFAPKNGRWPEVESPATRLGPVLGFFGTTASMIAIINNVVAGAGIAVRNGSLGRRDRGRSPSSWSAPSPAIGERLLWEVRSESEMWRIPDRQRCWECLQSVEPQYLDKYSVTDLVYRSL